MQLFGEFKEPLHGERNFLRGLQDERIATSDRIRQKPKRDHRGKVKRGDGGDHAEWLPDHDLVDAAGDVFEIETLH